MASTGFFGGFASGIRSGAAINDARRARDLQSRGLSLEDRRIGLAERKLKFDERVQAVEFAEGRVASTMKVVGEQVGIFANEFDPEDPAFGLSAVAEVESGNNYRALGPNIDTGKVVPLQEALKNPSKHAFGKYQIMGFNIPAWTEEILGRRMTAAEFVMNDAAQDRVALAKFGQFYNRTGNLADAASIWHSGRPLAEAVAAEAGDVNLKTEDYVNRVLETAGTLPTRRLKQTLQPVVDSAKKLAKLAGRDPALLDTMFESMIVQASPQFQEKIAQRTGRLEGLQAGAAEVAETQTLAAAGIAPEVKGEFQRLVRDWQAAPEGSPEKQFLFDRIKKLTAEETGMSIQVGPDGSISVTSGGAAGLPSSELISPETRTKLIASDQELTRGIETAQTLITEITKDPSLGGIVGSVRRSTETASGVATDIANMIPVLRPTVDRLKSLMGTDDAIEQLTGSSTTRFTDVLAAQLIYGVARSMQPEDRLLKSTIESARDQVNITGIRGTGQVIDQLNALVAQMESARADVRRRMESGLTGQPTTPRKPIGDAVPETTAPTKGPASPAPGGGDFEVIDGVRVRRVR